jgi:hypothetical protein
MIILNLNSAKFQNIYKKVTSWENVIFCFNGIMAQRKIRQRSGAENLQPEERRNPGIVGHVFSVYYYSAVRFLIIKSKVILIHAFSVLKML